MSALEWPHFFSNPPEAFLSQSGEIDALFAKKKIFIRLIDTISNGTVSGQANNTREQGL